MKKLLLVIVSVVVLFLIGIYIFIPATINISKVGFLTCPANSAERVIASQQSWQKWWPVKSMAGSNSDNAFYLNGYSFRVNRQLLDDLEILIQNDTETISSIVNILPAANDSCTFTWKCKLEAGMNPFDRLATYFEAGKIKKSMDEVTAGFKVFVSNKENIYGIKIEQVKVVDTLLITYKTGIKEFPTTQIIYGFINQLKDYAASQGAAQTNPPMLHLEQMDSALYGIMVAIPIDREIKDKGDFLFKRMPRGNILVSSEIQGGTVQVDKTYQTMTNYLTDYQRISPGLSFMSLITDRITEPDSSKWLTRIYYPVF